MTVWHVRIKVQFVQVCLLNPMSHALHVTYVLVHVHVLIKADDDARRRADRVFRDDLSLC